MLTDAMLAKIHDLNASLSPLQRAWLSGFLWGQVENGTHTILPTPETNTATSTIAPETKKLPALKITILSASQTGNARALAKQLTHTISALGIEAIHVNAADYKFKNIDKETHLILITSTQGEGEPPEEAVGLYKFLHSKKAPKLNALHYCVFGIGDSSYEDFCQTGKDFNQVFKTLGARELCAPVLSDIDYQTPFNEWATEMTAVLLQLKNTTEILTDTASTANTSSSSNNENNANKTENTYTKLKPLDATLSVMQKITGRDSTKDVRHIEIELGDVDFPYEPGDSLGVYFENDETHIDELLALTQINPNDMVVVNHQSINIRQALMSHLELSPNHPKFVEFYAQKTQHAEWLTLLNQHSLLIQFAEKTPILAMIRQCPVSLTAKELAESLRIIAPRSYSIASAQSLVDNEIHLTLGNVNFDYASINYSGSASHFLCNASEGQAIKIFLEPNQNFRLPKSPETPIIMIGAGTGIAPFRAFMQARESQKDNGILVGDHWLIFGNPNFTEDFLYQTEWLTYLKDGLLNKIDLAWSRDQIHKIYVSHKIIENAARIWEWIQKGAHVYVCGDAGKMAKDVEDALLQVIQTAGEMDRETADEYLTDLRIEKRYQRDVY